MWLNVLGKLPAHSYPVADKEIIDEKRNCVSYEVLLNAQNFPVNCFVLFAEYVENDFDSTVVFAFPVFYGLDGDLGGTVGWEMEDSGGNAAEGDRLHIVLFCEVEAACVAGC